MNSFSNINPKLLREADINFPDVKNWDGKLLLSGEKVRNAYIRSGGNISSLPDNDLGKKYTDAYYRRINKLGGPDFLHNQSLSRTTDYAYKQTESRVYEVLTGEKHSPHPAEIYLKKLPSLADMLKFFPRKQK